MRAVTGALAAALALAAGVSPAGAVGFGPLAVEGLTNSDRKGFYMTVLNPYPTSQTFRIYSVGWDHEKPEGRVLIPISRPMLAPKSQRRVLVVDTKLVPGEEHRFRVCAEHESIEQEALIHARVCSKLIARRIP